MAEVIIRRGALARNAYKSFRAPEGLACTCESVHFLVVNIASIKKSAQHPSKYLNC